jgi:hypothetical protein
MHGNTGGMIKGVGRLRYYACSRAMSHRACDVRHRFRVDDLLDGVVAGIGFGWTTCWTA